MACQSDDERADDVKAMLERAALNKCDGNYRHAKRLVAMRVWADSHGATKHRTGGEFVADLWPEGPPCSE